MKDSKYLLFILETNGILLGADRDYVKQLAEFKEKLYARAAAMTDSKVMPEEERRILIAKLSEIDRDTQIMQRHWKRNKLTPMTPQSKF